MYCIRNDLVDFLDPSGSFAAGIGKGLDLTGDDGKAFAGFACPHGFYGCVEGDQICCGRDRHDILGKIIHLIHTFTVLDRFF